MQNIKSRIVTLRERLSLMFEKRRSMVLEVEVISDDNPTESSAENHQTTGDDAKPSDVKLFEKLNFKDNKHKLYIRISAKTIKVDGSRTEPYRPLLIEDNMSEVLSQHPRLQDVVRLVVRNHQCLYGLPVSIRRLTNLTTLDLSRNSLKSLPWSLIYLQKLRVLDLSDNCFQTLPPLLGQLPRLEQLLLTNNYLVTMPASVLLQLTNLVILQVDGNKSLIYPPMAVCRQGVTSLVAYVREGQAQRRDVWQESTLCYDPGDQFRNCARSVASLLEICVSRVLEYRIDFLTMPHVPHPLKRHLHEAEATKKPVKLAKCSECSGHFSSKEHFYAHSCKKRDLLTNVCKQRESM